MLVACFVCIALILIAVCVICLLLSEVRNMTESLREINSTETNAKIRLSVPNRVFERLAVEINHTIDRKQEALARYRRMDSQFRSDIANISHDMRTPLTSVLGYMRLMEDERLDRTEREKYRQVVVSRAKDLEQLITSFFDLSRLEADEYGLELKPVVLQNVLSELLASYYQEFLSKGIEPQIEIDAGIPCVWADEKAIRRVLSNLIKNMINHGAGAYSIKLARENGFAAAVFKNRADSIAPTDVPHIFERFYTADRVRSGHNTGLGLAIVKALMEKMNGEVSAEMRGGVLQIKTLWKLAG